MFRSVPLSIIRRFSLYTQQTCMTYTIAVCAVKTTDDGQRNCPKYLEFYSKNKFEKLVHLVGFITRLYHDARSPECQNMTWLLGSKFPKKIMDPCRWEQLVLCLESSGTIGHLTYCHCPRRGNPHYGMVNGDGVFILNLLRRRTECRIL